MHNLQRLVALPLTLIFAGAAACMSVEQAVTALGIYEDEYARTAAGWRIQHRVYTQLMPAPGEQ